MGSALDSKSKVHKAESPPQAAWLTGRKPDGEHVEFFFLGGWCVFFVFVFLFVVFVSVVFFGSLLGGFVVLLVGFPWCFGVFCLVL